MIGDQGLIQGGGMTTMDAKCIILVLLTGVMTITMADVMELVALIVGLALKSTQFSPFTVTPAMIIISLINTQSKYALNVSKQDIALSFVL